MSTAVAFKSTREMLRAATSGGYELTLNDVIDLVCGNFQIHVPTFRTALESSPHFGVVSRLSNEYVAKDWSDASCVKDLKSWVKSQLGA